MEFNPNFQEFDKYGICTQPEEAVDLFVSININDKEEVLPIQQQTVFTNIANDDQVFESIMRECRSISESLNVHPYIAFMLLESQNWNVHLVYENWSTMHDSMLAELGVQLSNANEDPSLRHANFPEEEEIECEVCYDTFHASEMWCLPCGHVFCADCWRTHVNTHVASGQHLISCQQSGCKRKLPPNSVEMLCGKKVYNDFLRYLMDTTVSLADTLTICPSRNCNKPVNVLSTGLCNVLKCVCGHEFCSLCKSPSHAPANCVEKTFWGSITGDEIMKQRLLGENVKICPNCKAIIEKNGGCNHMTCQHCHHEFCWMCGKEWKSHPQTYYECKAYRKEDDPYLKKPDNINKELLEPYHDKFVHLDLENKSLFDKIEKNADSISLRIKQRNESDRQVVIDLLRLIYWTKENFRWSQVHLFNLRYQDVKNARTEDQLNIQKYPYSKKYLFFKIALADAETAVQKVMDILFKDSGKDLTIPKLLKYSKQIRLYRESLLKQCDPHYENLANN